MPDQIETINPNGLPTPVAPYSHVSRWGQLVFVAGQLALDSQTSKPLSDRSAKDQARAVLEYVSEALQAAGSSLDRVIKTTIYLTDLGAYADVNEVYAEFFSNHHPPRATVEVSGLVGGLTVEIEAVAIAESL